MASYNNPQLRDKLAAEYVVGTLRGHARARFQALLRYDPGLRRIVAEWEARLTPLTVAAGGIEPPARVWQAVVKRIAGGARGGGTRRPAVSAAEFGHRDHDGRNR